MRLSTVRDFVRIAVNTISFVLRSILATMGSCTLSQSTEWRAVPIISGVRGLVECAGVMIFVPYRKDVRIIARQRPSNTSV